MQGDDALRFHPSCPFGGLTYPCMIALFRDIQTNAPKAIHRTALGSGGIKLGRKALGPIGGCAIKLSDDVDVEQSLVIGEGVETVLAGMQLGFRPAWALGSAGAIKSFPVLAGIEALTILVGCELARTLRPANADRFITGPGRDQGAVFVDVIQAVKDPEINSLPIFVWFERRECIDGLSSHLLYFFAHHAFVLRRFLSNEEARLFPVNGGPASNEIQLLGEMVQGGSQVMDRIPQDDANLMRDWLNIIHIIDWLSSLRIAFSSNSVWVGSQRSRERTHLRSI